MINEENEFIDVNDEVVTLVELDGTETDMVICERVPIGDRMFCLMQPLELPEDMDEDEAIPFEEFITDEGEEYAMVDDDELADLIFLTYEKMVEESTYED